MNRNQEVRCWTSNSRLDVVDQSLAGGTEHCERSRLGGHAFKFLDKWAFYVDHVGIDNLMKRPLAAGSINQKGPEQTICDTFILV